MKQPSRRQLRRILLAVMGCLMAVLAGAAVLLTYEPPFYAERAVPDGAGDDVEASGRRLMTKASALHAAISRPGGWEAAVTDKELNAWLAVDLPRNHPQWLPARISQPRLAFEPRHVLLGVRVGAPPLAAVAWADVEIVLRDVNHLSIVVDQAWLGRVPIPRPPILKEFARRIARLGAVTDLRMLDGRMVLMVHIPSTHDAAGVSYWLERLTIDAGELVLAGATRTPEAPANRLTPP